MLEPVELHLLLQQGLVVRAWTVAIRMFTLAELVVRDAGLVGKVAGSMYAASFLTFYSLRSLPTAGKLHELELELVQELLGRTDRVFTEADELTAVLG